MIGDPSGRSTERSMLDEAAVAHNLRGITRDIVAVLDAAGDGPPLPAATAPMVLDNSEWTRKMDVITFLRDVGRWVARASQR